MLPEIYDSEIDKIHRLTDALNTKYKQGVRDVQGAQDEIKERFAGIGFVVTVKWWETNVEGLYLPEVEFTGRTDPNFVFDQNQQVHEVTSDLLGLGEGGVIKSDLSSLILPPGHKH